MKKPTARETERSYKKTPKWTTSKCDTSTYKHGPKGIVIIKGITRV